MFCKRTLFWGLVVASTALLAAISVYCLARFHPPMLLAPFKATSSILVAQTDLFGSAPSFLYTFAVSLILCLCASTRAAALLHCNVWLGLSLLLEVTQHPILAKPLVEWTSQWSGVPGWETSLPFWSRGVFDALDTVATVAGALSALTLFVWLEKRTKNDLS